MCVCVLFLQHTKYKYDAYWLKANKIEFVEAAVNKGATFTLLWLEVVGVCVAVRLLLIVTFDGSHVSRCVAAATASQAECHR